MNNFYQQITLAGHVISVDAKNASFVIELLNGDKCKIDVSYTTYYEVLRNVGDIWRDRIKDPDQQSIKEQLGNPENDPLFEAKKNILKYIQLDRYIIVIGIYSQNREEIKIDARRIVLMHNDPNRYGWEDAHWWIQQCNTFVEQWLDALFQESREITKNDFVELYRTHLDFLGRHTDNVAQECATLSRFLYGLSSSYLLTGNERAFLAAKACAQYIIEAFSVMSHDRKYCFWKFGRIYTKNGTKEIVPSQNQDDLNSYALYEQIYALSGLAQYYRITQDLEILKYIRMTLDAFDRFYHDKDKGGYFSHIDTVTLSPDSLALKLDNKDNRKKKNWNSIGDHIPAYLINVLLAIDPIPVGKARNELEQLRKYCREILDDCVKNILDHFLVDDKSGSSLFSMDDFKEPSQLISKLRDATDPISLYLKRKLSHQFQQEIQAYKDGTDLSKAIKDSLVAEFNSLLEENLYQQETFASIMLSEETQSLLSKKDLSKEELQKLNRLLLEDAYPQGIAKSHKSPFVLERFDANWNPDMDWGWQKNRGIVGHNLKISWNLTRCGHYYSYLAEFEPENAEKYKDQALKCYKAASDLGNKMSKVGVDLVRGGIWDALERLPNDKGIHEFAWNTTKDFWQQEQAILAYYVMQGINEQEVSLTQCFLKLARACAAFWNLFFIDQDSRKSYFRTDENGNPVVYGEYRIQAGHAIAGYHTFELNYLAHIYIRTYVQNEAPYNNFVLTFRPKCDERIKSINVLPDFIPPRKLRIASIRINGLNIFDFNPDSFQIDICQYGTNPIIEVEFQCKLSSIESTEPPKKSNVLETKYPNKIAVLIESLYIPEEIKTYQNIFTEKGFSVELASNLYGNNKITVYSDNISNIPFVGEKPIEHLDIYLDVREVNKNLSEYAAILIAANYTSVRLRHFSEQEHTSRNAPAVQLIIKAMQNSKIIKGALCHGLWLLTPAPELLAGRRVNCHEVVRSDIENTGAIIDTHQNVIVDRDLVSGYNGKYASELANQVIKLIECIRRNQNIAS